MSGLLAFLSHVNQNQHFCVSMMPLLQSEGYIYIFKIQDTNSCENTCTSYHNIQKWWSEVMGGGNGVKWFSLVTFGADTQF